MARGLTTTVIRAMVSEEWRLHAALFGGRRFVAFPAFIAAAGGGTVWLLQSTGTGTTQITFGLHLLVLAFGLYTGSAGLVGRDALRDLLGDVTLLVFSARTLPVSERRLLGAFLVKDVGYYVGLFLLPLAVAYAPAALAAGAPLRVLLLWATLSGTFVVGLVVTFGVIAARSRGLRGSVALAIGAVALAASVSLGLDPLDLLPYGLWRGSALALPFGGLVGTALLAGASLVAFDPTYETPTRTAAPRLAQYRRALRSDPDGLLAKTLLDVSRSSGGYWKVLFSGGVLFVVTAGLIGLAGSITGRTPSTGLSFGAVLGLSSFTTYNWVTQFDDVEAYQAYPVAVGDVFDAKFRAFVVLGLPTALGYYALAIALWGGRLRVVAAGAVLLVGLSVYLFGLTVALAGLDPNEFLFDTVRFVSFTVGAAVPLVPILVVAFVLTPSGVELAGLAVAGLALGGVGQVLYRWSVPRWAGRYRAG